VLNKVRKADEKSVKADLHAVMNAHTAMKARSAARRFAERWGQAYPAAVACLRDEAVAPPRATPERRHPTKANRHQI
jgi:transposase-like protein